MSTPSFLAVSGSLRKDSYNTALLQAFARHAAGSASITLSHSVGLLPLYNEDLVSESVPDVIAAARGEVAAADAVIVASPEYNYGIPGPLKNWFDWMSRPFGNHVFLGKKVLVLGSTPGPRGGKGAVDYLRAGFVAIQADVVGEEVLISQVHELLGSSGTELNPALTEVFDNALSALQKA